MNSFYVNTFGSEMSVGAVPPNPENIDKAVKLNNRAFALSKAGRYSESEALHKQALTLKLATFGPDSGQVALTRDALGVQQLRQGKLEEAEFNLTEAVRIRNEVPNFDGAVSRDNLAQLLEAKGDLLAARETRLSRPDEMVCANYGVSTKASNSFSPANTFSQRHSVSETDAKERRCKEMQQMLSMCSKYPGCIQSPNGYSA